MEDSIQCYKEHMFVFNMGMIYLCFFVTILSASENYSKVHQLISLFEKKKKKLISFILPMVKEFLGF